MQNRCSYVTPKQGDNWLFYSNSGLKFTNTGVQINNIPSGVNTLSLGNSSACISDENGELLIYTNGQKVFNKDHEDITNGPNLNGNLGAPQTAIIIQNPSTPQMLYVFTVDEITSGAKGLHYSRVDLTAYSGKGGVMELNVPLLPSALSVITGVKHANGTDFWVVTHGFGNNNFYAYRVGSSGVNSTPVVSSVGMPISSNVADEEFYGTLKISPAGDKIALSSRGLANIQAFSFNNETGEVSNPITIPVTIPSPKHGPFFVEFSPDGSKLYTTCIHYSSLTGQQNMLYQYDLENGNFETLLNDVPLNQDVMNIQLARDGKIYVLRRKEKVIGVIENPNRSGLDCNYDENYISIDPAEAFGGFPNFVTSYFNIPPLDYDTKCDGDTTQFKMLNTSNVDFVDWDFGDPSSVNNTIPAGPTNPIHIFSGPGSYRVTYTEHYGGKSWTDSLRVTINPKPPQFFSPDTLPIVPGSTIHVYALPDMYSYFWQDGSTSIDYTITGEGDYTVVMEDMLCCRDIDTLTVKALDLQIPNAFSPDGDGLNDYFGILANDQEIANMLFTVYNKWGQMLWQTNNLFEKWDGKIDGNPVDTGIYTWKLTVNLTGNTMNDGPYTVTGTLMIFR